MNRTRAISLGITAVIAVLLFLWLRFAHITFSERIHEWPPRHDGEVVIVDDEQFFDVIRDVPVPHKALDNPSPVHNDVRASNQSDPAPASGTHMRNSGRPADAPSAVTSPNPSPVQAQTQEPAPAGPSVEELNAQREEEARRKANAAMNSAFNKANGSNNTANTGKEPGDSGSPKGSASGINGTGTGSVGGGWFLPAYAKVPATVTGSIKLMVKIDQSGKVVSVTFQGGDAPAATDANLRQAVEAEVRSRRFTRGNSPAPETATAYITYRFR